jgi:hypothetical protein
MTEEIKAVTIKLLESNSYVTYYLGDKLHFYYDETPTEETIIELSWDRNRVHSHFVIKTQEGSVLNYQNKYIVSWVIK